MVGKSPFNFEEDDEKKLFMRIMKGNIEFPADFDENAMDLIQSLLQVNPTKRLGESGVTQIKNHPFFASLNWEEMMRNQKKGPLSIRYDQNEIKMRALNINFDEDLHSHDVPFELPNFSFNQSNEEQDTKDKSHKSS